MTFSADRPEYPHAERLDLVEEIHGHRVADPYRWLEYAEAPETKEWSAAQDTLWQTTAAMLPGRAAFTERLTELMRTGAVSAPVWRGERAFVTRRDPDQDHAVLLVVEPDGTERVLVDPNALDPDGTTVLDAWQPDKEGRLLAVQLSTGGDEESKLSVLDVGTGETVEGPIDRCRYSPVGWLPGGEAFYYTRRLAPADVPAGEDHYHRRVYLHRVGTSPEDAGCVFGADRDKTEVPAAQVSRDGRWLVLSTSRGTEPRNDLWLADLHACSADAPVLRPVQEGVDARTGVHVGRDGRLYVFTDRDAPRGRLCVTDPATPEYDTWRELVPEDAEAIFEDFVILDGDELPRPVLLVSWSRHAASELTVHDLVTGERLAEVALPGPGTIGGTRAHPDGGHEAWFAFTSWAEPVRVLRYDARDGAVSTWATVPGEVPLPEVHTTRISCRSADGTTVYASVVSPTGAPDRPRPTVLYGYGGFNISMTPAYSATALAWAAAGGTYVVANLRGGNEEGEEWHRAGMFGNKQNVFDDFYAVAEQLIADGWTTREQLAASGGSNGGLLVGAAVTQRPDLFAAAVSSAPVLDMVRYERFFIGAMWNVEYGSADDPEALGWLLGYSPYHNAREDKAYPAVLLSVFDSDTRVDPAHARKMCAALQHATTSTRPVLLRRESNVGHSARSVSRMAAYTADLLAFLAAGTNLAP
ncbi:MAG: prolyl oligopeptidase family serine peptidase [Streptosporangiales bacterium]|nr:prolyl oligopeptidase family serine peptidase [Streptosporangiales bacterium]